MVSNLNLSLYSGSPPQNSDGNLKISNGPLYSKESVMKILTELGADSINVVTRKASRHIQKYDLDIDDGVLKLLKMALNSGKYLNSQWCEHGKGSTWSACDAYSVIENKWYETMHDYLETKWYIKFAIGKTGKLILIVSCHTSDEQE
ncbi:hypothetical protein FCS21_07185 [Colwellia ponticola]|uniref:Uncharacterized protein n=2 Tax=Colwellia ponticola TaxID=2304625 RepID=A0A8H2PMB2_9GAMM|nr:hypothetical protein FCS21_07185 [Colwellia ponticola]